MKDIGIHVILGISLKQCVSGSGACMYDSFVILFKIMPNISKCSRFTQDFSLKHVKHIICNVIKISMAMVRLSK